ncbi:hypothetical protein B0H13DRAFT_2288888 [Mycena leptocephala]|nr:hypothetical protein B0H13DRAFT_2288888 [Mycena leptocephala]
MSCASYAAWTKGIRVRMERVKIRSASAGGHGRFVAASAQARQDGRLISASADESSEYICGSGGTAQAEGQGYSERGVLVAWRARTGHEATGRVVGERECRPAPDLLEDAQASREGGSQVRGECAGRGEGVEDGYGRDAVA